MELVWQMLLVIGLGIPVVLTSLYLTVLLLFWGTVIGGVLLDDFRHKK